MGGFFFSFLLFSLLVRDVSVFLFVRVVGFLLCFLLWLAFGLNLCSPCILFCAFLEAP